MTDLNKELSKNLKRFMIFRVLYSARFYYPIFTILFLDYGLTLEQFSILNLVWALTIVFAEVPSGALADILGRKRLLVFAAALMVVELVLLVFVPIGASTSLFIVFLLNRICSGLSEAAASGADEALAYDSLKALGRESDWSLILEKTHQFMSIGFFITMISGALVYDGVFVNKVLANFSEYMSLSKISLPQNVIIRLPVVLTLITSVIVFFTALSFYDLDKNKSLAVTSSAENESGEGSSLLKPYKQILQAASWTLSNHFVLFVIFAMVVLDSVARQFVILSSEYYRMIDIPIAWFGVIGAAMSLLGFVNARFSKYLVTYRSGVFNFYLLSLIFLVGLIGILGVIPIYGLFFVALIFMVMGMAQFQSSFYINREVESSHRATILSFKGLAINLGLGIASLLYTLLIALIRAQEDLRISGGEWDQIIFIKSLLAFPLYFLFLSALLFLLAKRVIKSREVFFKVSV